MGISWFKTKQKFEITNQEGPNPISIDASLEEVEKMIDTQNIQAVNELIDSFDEIDTFFIKHEKGLISLKSADDTKQIKRLLNKLETKTLDLRARMDELLSLAEKIENDLLSKRKSEKEKRELHLAEHEKQVIDYINSIEKIIDRIVQNIRGLKNLELRKIISHEQPPKDLEASKNSAKELDKLRKSLAELQDNTITLHNFENE